MQSNKRDLILTRTDLLQMEDQLCGQLNRFLAFSGHVVFFPAQAEWEPRHLSGEGRLFLPLIWREKMLGMLLLEGVKSREVKKLLPQLPQILALCLENLALCRAMAHDSLTGLHTEETFFAFMEGRAEKLRAAFADTAQTTQPLYKICLGMLVLDWPDAHLVAREFDHELRDEIYVRMASELAGLLPAEAVAAPLSRYDGKFQYAILFPASGRGACHRLASKIVGRLRAINFRDKHSQRNFNASVFAGYAIYPPDMAGEELALPVLEQGIRLRERARLASRMARNSSHGGIMPFARILQRGGRIIENAGGKLRINLGHAVGAREGMRFMVREDGSNMIKGQIAILESKPKFSLAEIIFLEDAGNLLQPGDRLVLLDKQARNAFEIPPETSEPQNPIRDISQSGFKFWSHGEFGDEFKKQSRNCARFVLAVARNSNRNALIGAHALDDFAHGLDGFLARAQKDLPAISPSLAGRYGSNSFLFFHPGASAAECLAFYERFTKFGLDCGLNLACGLFEWPFLNIGRGESEICAFKALEYAQLLPEPHIGVFDSLALTISADRRCSLGDTFGAMEEYKQALLADPRNQLARNSLGVCLAGIGKLEEAKKLCLEALENCAETSLKAKISYNIGTIYQKLDDEKNARDFYRRCLKLDPGHIYAGLRLGQLYMRRGRKANARKLFEKALELAGEDRELANLAQRQLARLEGGENKKARARLHDTLLRNPNDAASLRLLAQTYLQNREDPVTAELLARKSVNLSDHPEAWHILALALEEQGKAEEAAKAMERARRKTPG